MAATYSRVSTLEQANSGTSLATQEERTAAFINDEGWDLGPRYVDDGYSGSNMDRPGLRRLLAAARDGLFQVVVITDPDRLARDLLDSLLVERNLRACGVEVTFTSNPAMTTLERQVRGSFAEEERRKIMERTFSGLLRTAREGFWPGGPPPFGFVITRDDATKHSRLAIYEPEATTIRLIVECLVDRRLTTWQTAARLNDLGIETPSQSSLLKSPPKPGSPGRKIAPRWTHGGLRRLMLDAHGISGEWPYRRAQRGHARPEPPIMVNIPAIITAEQHERLYAALARTSTGPGATARKKPYLLTGRLTSPCGGRMHGTRRPDRDTAVYRCQNSRSELGEARCDCRRCDAGALDTIVWAEVEKVLTDPERLIALARAAIDLTDVAEPIANDDIAAIDARIDRAERALGTTLADLARRGLDPGAIEVASATLAADLERLKEHRRQVATWRQHELERADRMQRLVTLAAEAQQVLANPAPMVAAGVLNVLNVHVAIQGWTVCEGCGGRGLVPTSAEPRSRRRGATGLVCSQCSRHRYIPIVEISGVVPDTASITKGSTTLDATYPFRVVADSA